MFAKGYHATSIEKAHNILREKRFKPSEKNNEWLGTGVYFFLDINDTKWWNRRNVLNGKYTRPAVLSAQIHCDNNSFIDLDDEESMQRFMSDIQGFYTAMAQMGVDTFPEFDSNAERRCHNCNLFREINPEIKVIAFTFPKDGNNIRYNKYGFPEIVKHKQICVSDNDCINSISIERRTSDYAI